MPNSVIFEYVLVVAGSGRMLAQAAKNAGLKPLAIDLFADLDTRVYAEDFVKIRSLAEEDLRPAVDFFIGRYAVTHAIYGSGFECYPESLHYLSKRLIVLGNPPDTFARVQSKAEFFAVLSDLSIPYPEVSFNVPAQAGNWLVKPLQGQGGIGIKPADYDSTDNSVYWQKYQSGTPHSVLFLADGQTVQSIGFNTQWTVPSDAGEAFIFSGIINSSNLSAKQKILLLGWLAGLVPELSLKGLNSIDFIQDGDGLYVLEINPRLPASMQLYGNKLLMRHILASQGEMADGFIRQVGFTAYQIVYADYDVLIPDVFEWPDGCVDLPAPGVNCRKGQPICSIIASQNTPKAVFEQLQHAQQQIFNQLNTGSTSWNTQQALINFPSL
ncbi:MAG: ATP-grasp domain-containing protein [Methylovulum sp.]|nr:ATP-grasp domain-containing protein [Methylovulum sp.]